MLLGTQTLPSSVSSKTAESVSLHDSFYVFGSHVFSFNTSSKSSKRTMAYNGVKSFLKRRIGAIRNACIICLLIPTQPTVNSYSQDRTNALSSAWNGNSSLAFSESLMSTPVLPEPVLKTSSHPSTRENLATFERCKRAQASRLSSPHVPAPL